MQKRNLKSDWWLLLPNYQVSTSTFSKSNPLAYSENLNILSCEMPKGQLLDSGYRLTQLDVPKYYWSREDYVSIKHRNLISALSLVMTKGSITWLVLNSFRTVPTPTVSLEHEFFLEELFFYRYSGIASETTLLIRFRLVMRFRRTLQDPGPSMCKWDNPNFTFQIVSAKPT
ncbi:hypothetical protein L1887_12113 [Cichorium endivia]|nr:hypothetical protein L1887_12113 [Cichorium endivia]